MCADASLPTNAGSELVAELPWSYLRLVHNQTHAGYCVVVLKQHLPELDDPAPDYLVMGHRVPHLHCHVYPQYEDDDPLYNVNIGDGDVRQDDSDRAGRIALLRAAIDGNQGRD
jgi:diadenosine tetraphosphate (Ap4A) HIT family hydrolase